MPLTPEEKALYALARERIAKRLLPDNVPASLWGGRGQGCRCCICDQLVSPEQIEYELTGYHMHLRCHAIWQLAVTNESALAPGVTV